MAAWALILIGAGMGMVAGFFLASALGLAKEADRQAEVDFWRLSLNKTLFGGMCEMCFRNRAYHVHHMTYAQLGNEWIFDLAAICADCHAAIHPDLDS